MVTSGAVVTTVNMANGPTSQGDCAPTTASNEGPNIMSSRRTSESRRSNKPIMEKRRRARINNCLNELKTLILDAMKKDPARHSKLEKADILEMTVRHLESIQRKNAVLATATDPSVMNKFRAGFSECASEVSKFPGLEPSARRRLLQHLADYLNGPEAAAAAAASSAANTETDSSPSAQQPTGQAVQIHIVPSDGQPGAGGNFFLTTSSGAMQLMPTDVGNRLAVLLPSLQSPPLSPSSSRSSPPPSPSSSLSVPHRTSSTASSSSMFSTSTSPVVFERLRVDSPPCRLEVPVPRQAEDQPQNFSQRDASSPVSTSSSYSPSSAQYSSSPLSSSGGSSCEALRTYNLDEMQKPLALVTRENYNVEASDEEQPWRPW